MDPETRKAGLEVEVICGICKHNQIPEWLSTIGGRVRSIAASEGHCDYCGMKLGLTPEEYAQQSKELREQLEESIKWLTNKPQSS